ncbi:MAG: menaquinone biosynthetic enzyme MqnA/MqnD family protein [Bacteroidales bacterium]
MNRITVVSYINTFPFIYGIEKSGFLKSSDYQLTKVYPSLCSQAYHNRITDIVLLPSGAINHYDESITIKGNCIGAEGKVKSVMLFSQKPIEDIKTLILDYQSTTSIKLVKILAKFYWKKQFEFLSSNKDYEQKINNDAAILVIGDRALDLIGKYNYSYDLATEWFKFQQLPFVFAYWVKTKPVDFTFIEKFNRSLNWGLNHKKEALETYLHVDQFLLDYLEYDISYNFDKQKIEGLKAFYRLSKEIY